MTLSPTIMEATRSRRVLEDYFQFGKDPGSHMPPSTIVGQPVNSSAEASGGLFAGRGVPVQKLPTSTAMTVC